jgi:hypothetical protein
MLEVCRNADLLEKPLAAKHRGKLRQEYLHGHRPPVLEVLGEIHGGHAATPQFALDTVAVGQRLRETLRHVAHARNLCGPNQGIR